mmetsp:Transcript_73833/g.238632  ORF Transcript_73833/g.238632 Transcript_73833/m.238632 type:complete len:237 (-) Transcript_73833:332-1042(-)
MLLSSSSPSSPAGAHTPAPSARAQRVLGSTAVTHTDRPRALASSAQTLAGSMARLPCRLTAHTFSCRAGEVPAYAADGTGAVERATTACAVARDVASSSWPSTPSGRNSSTCDNRAGQPEESSKIRARCPPKSRLRKAQRKFACTFVSTPFCSPGSRPCLSGSPTAADSIILRTAASAPRQRPVAESRSTCNSHSTAVTHPNRHGNMRLSPGESACSLSCSNILRARAVWWLSQSR